MMWSLSDDSDSEMFHIAWTAISGCLVDPHACLAASALLEQDTRVRGEQNGIIACI
jgi:hypothetical protein